MTQEVGIADRPITSKEIEFFRKQTQNLQQRQAQNQVASWLSSTKHFQVWKYILFKCSLKNGREEAFPVSFCEASLMLIDKQTKTSSKNHRQISLMKTDVYENPQDYTKVKAFLLVDIIISYV